MVFCYGSPKKLRWWCKDSSFSMEWSLAFFLMIIWLYILFHRSICLSLCPRHTILITIDLLQVLKPGSMSLPALLFFFKFVLAIWRHSISVYILGWILFFFFKFKLIPILSTCHWDFDRGCTNLWSICISRPINIKSFNP